MSRTASLDMPVRWGDLDAFNHVNNTVFLRYIEEARIRFFDDLGEEWLNDTSGPVVVNINCSFRREIRYPATVRVRTKAYRASEKRLVMEHQLLDADDESVLYSDAEVIILWVDTQAGGSIPLPEPVVTALGED